MLDSTAPPSLPLRAATRAGLLCAALVLAGCALGPRPPLGPGDAALRRALRECEAGSARACERAGRRYMQGSGVRQDLERAAGFLERACEGGADRACVTLGSVLRMRGDASGGETRFAQSCEAGIPGGCYALAERVRARDPERAAMLFERACERGFTAGCYSLGAMLARESDSQRDLGRAAALFDRACDANDGRACFALAFLLQRGSGIAADADRADALFDRAREFFQDLCAIGEGYACHNLAMIYGAGLGTAVRSNRARELLGRACQLGNRASCAAEPGSRAPR